MSMNTNNADVVRRLLGGRTEEVEGAVPWPINELDVGFHPLYPGELTLVGGRTSVGRSSLLLSMAAKLVCKYEYTVLFVSAKQGQDEVRAALEYLCRYQTEFLGYDEQALVRGVRRRFERRQIVPYELVRGERSLDDVAELARDLFKDNEGVIFVDDVDFATRDTGYMNIHPYDVQEGLCLLRSLANELNVPVVASALCHAARGSGYSRPSITELSYSVEDYSDRAILLDRARSIAEAETDGRPEQGKLTCTTVKDTFYKHRQLGLEKRYGSEMTLAIREGLPAVVQDAIWGFPDE